MKYNIYARMQSKNELLEEYHAWSKSKDSFYREEAQKTKNYLKEAYRMTDKEIESYSPY